jgi:hypothetical protein
VPHAPTRGLRATRRDAQAARLTCPSFSGARHASGARPGVHATGAPACGAAGPRARFPLTPGDLHKDTGCSNWTT